MNLTAFSQMLLRRGWLMAVLGVGGAVLGLAFAVVQTPVYEAVTRVAVRPKRPADLGQSQAIKEVLRSYQQDIATVDMAQAVNVRLSQDPRCAPYAGDPGRLLWQVLGVGTDENVYEIQVKARSRDLTEAVCVSEKWAEAFVDRREKVNRQLDPLDRIVTEQRDVTVPHRVWPRRRLSVRAAGVGGVLVGGLLVLSIEYLERAVIRDPRDAEQVVGCEVLGTVPGEQGQSSAGMTALRRALAEGWPQAGRLLRLAWPVVALAVVGGGSAFVLSALRPPVYLAQTRIAVEPARGSDWGQTQGLRETMRGFSEDIRTRRMAEEVNNRLQLDLPPERLLAKLNVAPRESVYEILVAVRDPDPEVAAAISREWAQLFVEEQAQRNLELDQRDRILTRLRDQTQTERWAPKPVPNTLAGTVLGVLVGAAALFLLHLARRGLVFTARDAAGATRAPVLALIPPPRRASGGGR